MTALVMPTQQEVMLGENDVIISKTDVAGRITYVNRVFMRIANHPEKDVLHQPHSIVRHPDMPRGIFALQWETLKVQQEFFGYVKNLTSDGQAYWTFSNVTPDLDAQGQVAGYFSVGRRPAPSAIAAIQPLYAEMLEVERRAGPAAAPAASLSFLMDKLKGLGTSYDRFILNL